MTTFLLFLMTLMLIAALERNHRRQSIHPRSPHRTYDPDDRDWARVKLDLQALGTQQRGDTNRHNDPRPA